MPGSFFGGFTEGFTQADQASRQRQQLQLQRQGQERLQQIEQNRALGDNIKYFSDVIKNADEEQVKPLTNMFLAQVEQTTGKTIAPSVKAAILADPTQAGTVLMNAYAEAQGNMDVKKLGQIFASPQAYIGLTNAFNMRKQAKEASEASATGFGQVESTITLPGSFEAPQADYNLRSQTAALPEAAPSTRTIKTQAPTPGLTDLRGMQGQLDRVDTAISRLSALEPSKEINDRISQFQKLRDQILAQQKQAFDNQTLSEFARQGIDPSRASPEVWSAVQNQVRANAGLAEEAITTGRTMGTPLPTETAAFRNVPAGTLYRGLSENQPGGGGIAQPQPGAKARGVPPTPIEAENTKALIAQGQELHKEVSADASSSRSELQTYEVLKVLLPQAKLGKLGPARIKFDAIAKDLFGVDTKGLEESQAFHMFSQAMGLNLLNSLKGAATEKEEKWILEMIPTLSTDPGAAQMFIGIKSILAERKRVKSNMLDQYQRECGVHGQGCSETFSIMFDKWARLSKNDLTPMLEAVRAKYGAPAPASFQSGGATGSFGTAVPPTRNINLPVPSSNQGGAAFVTPRP